MHKICILCGWLGFDLNNIISALMFSFSAVFWMNNISSGFNWIGKKKKNAMTSTYIVIASRAPLIRLPDAHLKFECNVLHLNVDFYFKFDEYSKFVFFFFFLTALVYSNKHINWLSRIINFSFYNLSVLDGDVSLIGTFTLFM